MNVAKLSAIANRLLQLALEVEDGGPYLTSHTLVQISQEISSLINQPQVKPILHDCWAHLKGMTGNLSPPPSPECNCSKKVSFDLE